MVVGQLLTPHPHRILQELMQFDHLVMTQFLPLIGHPIQGEKQGDENRDPPQDIAGLIKHLVGHTHDSYDQCGKSDGGIEKDKHGPDGRAWSVQPT